MIVSGRHTILSISCGTLGVLMSLIAHAKEENIFPVDGYIDLNDKGSELQLEVRQMSLERVLSTLSAKIHVPIHYSVVPEGLVTANCVGSTLPRIMECLLDGKADLIVRYRKQSLPTKTGISAQAVPLEMWVLGSRISDATSDSAAAVTQAQEVINDSSAITQTTGSNIEESNTDDWLKMAKAQEASVRASAIGALMTAKKEDDAKVKPILEEALSDPDASVRAQAISSLAHREGAAATSALQKALLDTDAEVRLMAVDGAGDDTALLQQALNDDDQAVRQLAVSKLEELNK